MSRKPWIITNAKRKRMYIDIMCRAAGKSPLAMKRWLYVRGMKHEEVDDVIEVILLFCSKYTAKLATEAKISQHKIDQ